MSVFQAEQSWNEKNDKLVSAQHQRITTEGIQTLWKAIDKTVKYGISRLQRIREKEIYNAIHQRNQSHNKNRSQNYQDKFGRPGHWMSRYSLDRRHLTQQNTTHSSRRRSRSRSPRRPYKSNTGNKPLLLHLANFLPILLGIGGQPTQQIVNLHTPSVLSSYC